MKCSTYMQTDSGQGWPADLLDDLLHQCPAVLEKVRRSDASSLSALLATSRKIRNRISAVLEHIDLGFKTFPSTGLVTYQAWPVLRRLSIHQSQMSLSAATYLVNSSLPQLRDLDVAWSPLTVQTAAKLSEGNWPKLESLGLSNCISSADALQQIAKGSWPMLVNLDICRCEQARCNYFQMQDFLLTDLDPLQTSQWPLLQRLSARGWNCIHLSDKSQQCRWPNLSSFSTSHVNAWGQVPSLQELSFHCITRSDSLLNALSLHLPTLKQLSLDLFRDDEAYSSPDVAQALASHGCWPALEKLILPNQQLGRMSMAPLLQTSWSQLQELDLSSNYLQADCIECLVACEWPYLGSLSLTENELDAEAIEVLIQGKWPMLCHLDLTAKYLCAEACQLLARGLWPRLFYLGLRECGIDRGCLYQLSHGCWPDRDEMDLNENADLSVVDVYSVAQVVVVHKVVVCQFAGMFDSWLKDYGQESFLSKASDRSSDEPYLVLRKPSVLSGLFQEHMQRKS